MSSLEDDFNKAIADSMTPDQLYRLNQLMSGYGSKLEYEAAKKRPVQVDVTQTRLESVASRVIMNVLRKNHDYGNAWQALGVVGAAARFVDKMFRIERLANGQEALVVDEKLADTLADYVGYGLLILLYEQFKEIDNREGNTQDHAG